MTVVSTAAEAILTADEADDQDQHEQREDEEHVPAGEHACILTYADIGI